MKKMTAIKANAIRTVVDIAILKSNVEIINNIGIMDISKIL
ncbi:hypothetical protein [Butyrivibrio fibrisolvens]